MGKMEKKENHATKVTKIPEDENMDYVRDGKIQGQCISPSLT